MARGYNAAVLTVPQPARPASEGAHTPTQFVLKVHSRCNLACDYCYVYTGRDQTWRQRPRVMSQALMDACVNRIAGHAARHGLERVSVILHGGEPLLAGSVRLSQLVGRLRQAFDGLSTELDLLVQTNGVLLDEELLDVFAEFGVSVGVSLDGDAAAHDRHRVDRRGRGSHSSVTAALALLRQRRYRHLYGGVLCTVDVRNDPVRTFEGLLVHDPPMIDFLLPHGTWDAPPPGLSTGATPYGDWLVTVFDRWYRSGDPRTRVRLFESLVDLCLGGWSTTESVGHGPSAVLVVETDGSIETHDTLKVVAARAGATELSVLDDDLDEPVGQPERLGAKCLACPVVDVCGGGLRTHRYRSGSGFANESVYCRDLRRLIDHVKWCLLEKPPLSSCARAYDELMGRAETERT